MEFAEIIKKCWNGEVVVVNKNDMGIDALNSMKEVLLKEGIIIDKNESEYRFTRFSNRENKKKEEVLGHVYQMPEFSDEVDALLQMALNGESCNLCLSGPAGSGKSEFVREICKRNGYGKVFQVNGRDDMDSSDFFGEKTVVVDPISKQNYIEFKKGPLYQAFIEGTELDENGDQILYDESGNRVYDESGNPKVVGKPAVFFLDEFAALIPSVFLSVFNRAMEIPRVQGASRVIEISADGGKIVKSHPAFAMFLAGNTVGKGTESDSQMGYTAQNNQMDDSTLNRITAFYQFGYNLDAEREIVITKLNDDRDVNKISRFAHEIRKQWQNGNVETLLSTRAIVQFCNLAHTFRKTKKDYLPLAIYRSVFSGLREREKAAWNETIRMIFGTDVIANYGKKTQNMFYTEKF